MRTNIILSVLMLASLSACSDDSTEKDPTGSLGGSGGGTAGTGGYATGGGAGTGAVGGTGGGTSGTGGTGGSATGGAGGASDAGDDAVVSDCPTGNGTFAVQRVDGTPSEGSSLVICGDLFGAVGPNIVLFADMENGQPGELVAETSPIIGEWLGGGTLFANDASRSGTMSMLVADSDINGGKGLSTQFGVPDSNGAFGLREFDEFFMSWALRDLGDFPGNNSSPTSFSSDSSAKDIWMMFGNRGDNYDYSCSTGECNGNDIVLATHTGQGSFKNDGNTTGTSWWLGSFWQFQTWNAMSAYMKIDPNDPYGSSTGVFEHVSATSAYLRDEYDSNLLKQLDGLDPVWDRFKFGAWYRTAGDVRRVMDDVYLAIGPGAAARVEIANAPQVESATKIAVSTVDSWTNGRIEMTVRLGDLDPSADSLYVFVVDANNERSAGFPMKP